jgi:hypothetical protein
MSDGDGESEPDDGDGEENKETSMDFCGVGKANEGSSSSSLIDCWLSESARRDGAGVHSPGAVAMRDGGFRPVAAYISAVS